jgi:hypothetical protein
LFEDVRARSGTWVDRMKTVWVYINTAKEVGDVDRLEVFANEEAAKRWFTECLI